VGAGLAMQAALGPLNEDFAKKGWPEIKIGVGVNTGPMSVGNMGSTFRQAYTVLGDAVNLGSRLEGITKVYGVGFIVAQATAEKAHEYLYREMDKVRVKGKDLPVTILEPMGLRTELSDEVKQRVDEFSQALSLYRQQSWDEAEAVLRSLLEDEPDSVLYALYLDRIELFREDPPATDWDGVFTHKTK
jgi:adenylate cyclase